MGSINLYLSRQANGDYMLTDEPPLNREVKDSGHFDLYGEPGSGVIQRGFCKIIADVAEAKLRRLESVPVRVTVEVLEGQRPGVEPGNLLASGG